MSKWHEANFVRTVKWMSGHPKFFIILYLTENKLDLKLDIMNFCIEPIISANISIEMDQI